MISQSGKNILQNFVTKAKALLTKNVISMLQQHYGIWQDGTSVPVTKLTTKDTQIIHVAQMLRERIKHIQASLPDGIRNPEKNAVSQLIAEQAFTILNRFCALRMCEERDLIIESIKGGYNSGGFLAYDMVTGGGASGNQYERYQWYIRSIFDELSIELPSVFNRFSPYGLLFPEESTLIELLDLINDVNLTNYYDEQCGQCVNFWMEDETIGWIYQYYNSLEERRKMREESAKPRNSREMAVRNQFFTPDYVVRFLTDNSLGRIWYEMTGGKSHIREFCKYMVCKDGEVIPDRALKDPTEISILDPTCGSMHFGLYAYEVMEYIYLDAWDNHPDLLHEYRYSLTREQFQSKVPALILENNIFGCEIDPRALQIAALSLWLRAQRSYSEINIDRASRPMITRSNLVLAEAMPGNKRLLNALLSDMDAPMKRLITKIWDKMKFVGEAGLLIKMEKEIEDDIEELKKNWSKINATKLQLDLFDSSEEEIKAAERAVQLEKKEVKAHFFAKVSERLQEALHSLSQQLSEEEGYENTLFANDATRGFAFIELCQKRFDVILMNPPFGEGSENTSPYLDEKYPTWCSNLVCAFFDRMQEMLTDDGKVGAIFDRTVLIKSSYETFRQRNICGFISYCADTGWGVLDAQVETSTLVLTKHTSDNVGIFMDVLSSSEKEVEITQLINCYQTGGKSPNLYSVNSSLFAKLPNTIIGYYFNDETIKLFANKNINDRGLTARQGHAFISSWNYRLFYEIKDTTSFHSLYNGGSFTQYYIAYRDVVKWENDGKAIKAHKSFRNSSGEYQLHSGVGYGKRGDIVDSHILKKNTFFTVEGLAIPKIKDQDSLAILSLTNSILGQYSINLYTAQHKHAGYMNLLPMPNFEHKRKTIEDITSKIIDIKRDWFSLDETNLEYRGLISRLSDINNITASIEDLQNKLNSDYLRYTEYVKQNDELWISLADIKEDGDFRKTLNEYTKLRPSEELISIDNATNNNIIDKKIIAQEIIMELVGLAFGRWDIKYRQNPELIPAFGDVFEALPFMPTVSLSEKREGYPINFPADGILTNDESADSLIKKMREAMVAIWGDKADDIEYELCNIIGCADMLEYLNSPTGFFAYHFTRYTKSRRKAPIYWPLTSERGKITLWVYYPKMNDNTLAALILRLSNSLEVYKSELSNASLRHDRAAENEARVMIEEHEGMIEKLRSLIAQNYVPNHDDGVPVTAAPLAALFGHSAWRNECQSNLKLLQEGEYDWSHLAYSMFPNRIREKVKKDWCLALTHSLEELCDNKPKPKKERKANKVEDNSLF